MPLSVLVDSKRGEVVFRVRPDSETRAAGASTLRRVEVTLERLQENLSRRARLDPFARAQFVVLKRGTETVTYVTEYPDTAVQGALEELLRIMRE